jgi:hypothetical protein
MTTFETVMNKHPKPWKVKYKHYCNEWDQKSRPYIVDANDHFVCLMPQNVCHPGVYDELADYTAIEIVNAVNSLEALNRSINSDH